MARGVAKKKKKNGDVSSGDEYNDLYISDEPQEISAPQEISERPDFLKGKEFKARDPFKHQQENVVASDNSCHSYNARSGPGYSGEKDNSKVDTATCVQCGRESSVAGKQTAQIPHPKFSNQSSPLGITTPTQKKVSSVTVTSRKNLVAVVSFQQDSAPGFTGSSTTHNASISDSTVPSFLHRNLVPGSALQLYSASSRGPLRPYMSSSVHVPCGPWFVVLRGDYPGAYSDHSLALVALGHRGDLQMQQVATRELAYEVFTLVFMEGKVLAN